MRTHRLDRRVRRAPLLIAATLLGAVAIAWPAVIVQADPPAHARGGKKGSQGERSARQGAIAEADRDVLHRYFGDAARSGRCPPGLAKKNNGCMPPGQAKKWARGQRLPGDLTYYALPGDLLAQLVPPAGAQYVRVAADILLIATGTGLVLDAVEDLMRL
jgi:Ni/Co efflux regulator RcnB